METEPYKLKSQPESGYSMDECAASRCRGPCDVIDATSRFWDGRIPLCSRCFDKRPDPPKQQRSQVYDPGIEAIVQHEDKEFLKAVDKAIGSVTARIKTSEPHVSNTPKEDPPKVTKPKKIKLESHRLF